MAVLILVAVAQLLAASAMFRPADDVVASEPVIVSELSPASSNFT